MDTGTKQNPGWGGDGGGWGGNKDQINKTKKKSAVFKVSLANDEQ